MLMSKKLLPLILFVCIALVASGAERKVVLVAGPDSHGWNAHEHGAGCEIMAKGLAESGLDIKTEVVKNVWPEDWSVFGKIDTVVIYCDGGPGQLLEGHADDIAQLKKDGVGLVIMHYALEAEEEVLRQALLEGIGAYFEVNWSVNPTWHPSFQLAEHPATNGVKPFDLPGEWYFHMRFREGTQGVTPVLSAMPTLDILSEEETPRSGNATLREEITQGKIQHMAWVAENKDGTRGFGFTGGHEHFSWTDDNYRKLLLNSIVWVLDGNVPEGGVKSERPIIVKYEVMMQAVAKGDADDVDRHLILGAKVNEANKSGWTALHYATVRNQEAVAKVLLKHGADVNALSKTNNAAIHYCAERDLTEIAKLLIDNGADLGIRDNSGWTPLHTAAAKDNLAVAKVLIEGDADVNRLSRLGGTSLHEAAASGGKELIQLLLDNGVDTTVVSSTGATALSIATEFKNEAALALLDK
jgi:hypothetical protein